MKTQLNQNILEITSYKTKLNFFEKSSKQLEETIETIERREKELQKKYSETLVD